MGLVQVLMMVGASASFGRATMGTPSQTVPSYAFFEMSLEELMEIRLDAAGVPSGAIVPTTEVGCCRPALAAGGRAEEQRTPAADHESAPRRAERVSRKHKHGLRQDEK